MHVLLTITFYEENKHLKATIVGFLFNLRVTDVFNSKGKAKKKKKAPLKTKPTRPPSTPPTEIFIPNLKISGDFLQLNAKLQHGKLYVNTHIHTYIFYISVCVYIDI